MLLWHTRWLKILLISFSICILSPSLFSSRAFAFADPITVTSQADTVTFPKGIDFQAGAHDASSTITQATIFFMYNANGGFQEHHQVDLSTPMHNVVLHWHQDTSSNETFTPPGTLITYYWLVQDSAGNSHTGTQQTFSVVDNRFSWQHQTQGMLQVNWYNRPASFGQAVLDQASLNIKRIGGNLGGGLKYPINLWVYQSSDDFHGSLPPQTYEWVGGIAFPSLNQASVVVDSLADDTLIRDMPHELTHLIFHQLIAQGIFAPVWFDEGMAVYNQIYHEPLMTSRFKDALSTHSLIALNDISLNFPADGDKAYLAYAQSWNLIDYMFHTFGKLKVAALIRAMNNPQSDFEQDMTLAFGVDPAHLENQWHLYLNQPATLRPDQLTPATSPIQKTIALPTTTDSNAPLLILVGLLLILLPIFGISGLLAYQRRCQVPALPQVPPMVANPQPPFDVPPSNQYLPYTSPARYTGQPMPYPMQMSHPAPSSPYPANVDGDQTMEDASSLQFLHNHNQEYASRQPNKQAPQE